MNINQMGVGDALSVLRNGDSTISSAKTDQGALSDSKPAEEVIQRGVKRRSSSSEWETVSNRAEKRQKTGKKKSRPHPAFVHSPQSRLQSTVKLQDLQGLVLYLLSNGSAPQWLSVQNHSAIKKAVVLMVPGLEMGMFDGRVHLDEGDELASVSSSTPALSSHLPEDYYPTKLSAEGLPDVLQPLASLFEHVWPIRTPGDDKFFRMHSPLQAVLSAALPKSKEQKSQKNVKRPREENGWTNQPTHIREFVATAEDLRDFDFPLHPTLLHGPEEVLDEDRRREKLGLSTERWIDTDCSVSPKIAIPKEASHPQLNYARHVLAIDCEMCKVEGGTNSLTRISIVDWDGSVVVDEYVKPKETIIDYLTPYSGVTKGHLENVRTSLEDIQKRLQELLVDGTILVGHSLESDLAALKITHPCIVDTTMLYPHPRGPPLRSSLKWLSQKYLGRAIQKGHGSTGHSSVEDAQACMDLVRQKCERGPQWGTFEASTESIFKRLSRTPSGSKEKTGAVVDWGQPQRLFGSSASICIACNSDQEVVKGVSSTINGDFTGDSGSQQGVDFVWARLRELEALRGWWNQNRQDSANLPPSRGEKDVNSATPRIPKKELRAGVTRCVSHICHIYESLPPCTAFIVYSGSGDPRAMSRMQSLHQQFKREYQTKKWDQLSVKWTDTEEQQLRVATKEARKGIGLMTVK